MLRGFLCWIGLHEIERRTRGQWITDCCVHCKFYQVIK